MQHHAAPARGQQQDAFQATKGFKSQQSWLTTEEMNGNDMKCMGNLKRISSKSRDVAAKTAPAIVRIKTFRWPSMDLAPATCDDTPLALKRPRARSTRRCRWSLERRLTSILNRTMTLI